MEGRKYFECKIFCCITRCLQLSCMDSQIPHSVNLPTDLPGKVHWLGDFLPFVASKIDYVDPSSGAMSQGTERVVLQALHLGITLTKTVIRLRTTWRDYLFPYWELCRLSMQEYEWINGTTATIISIEKHFYQKIVKYLSIWFFCSQNPAIW